MSLSYLFPNNLLITLNIPAIDFIYNKTKVVVINSKQKKIGVKKGKN